MTNWTNQIRRSLNLLLSYRVHVGKSSRFCPTVESCEAFVADLLGALPKGKCEDISSSCAVMNLKKPLRPLLDGSGFFLNMGKLDEVGVDWHNRLG